MARPLARIPLRCVALRPLRDPLSSPSSSSLASPSPRAAAHLLLPSSCASPLLYRLRARLRRRRRCCRHWRLGALPRRSPCRVRYNTFTAWFHNDAGGCCSSLFSPALVQCKANSGGRSRSQRAVLATSIRCLFFHQLRRLTWPQRRCVTQRLNASTVPPNTRLLR